MTEENMKKGETNNNVPENKIFKVSALVVPIPEVPTLGVLVSVVFKGKPNNSKIFYRF